MQHPEAGNHDREPGNVIGEPIQLWAGVTDGGAAGLVVGVQTVWVAQQQATNLPRVSGRAGGAVGGCPVRQGRTCCCTVP